MNRLGTDDALDRTLREGAPSRRRARTATSCGLARSNDIRR